MFLLCCQMLLLCYQAFPVLVSLSSFSCSFMLYTPSFYLSSTYNAAASTRLWFDLLQFFCYLTSLIILSALRILKDSLGYVGVNVLGIGLGQGE